MAMDRCLCLNWPSPLQARKGRKADMTIVQSMHGLTLRTSGEAGTMGTHRAHVIRKMARRFIQYCVNTYFIFYIQYFREFRMCAQGSEPVPRDPSDLESLELPIKLQVCVVLSRIPALKNSQLVRLQIVELLEAPAMSCMLREYQLGFFQLGESILVMKGRKEEEHISLFNGAIQCCISVAWNMKRHSKLYTVQSYFSFIAQQFYIVLANNKKLK